jgi:hypothetical protein
MLGFIGIYISKYRLQIWADSRGKGGGISSIDLYVSSKQKTLQMV